MKGAGTCGPVGRLAGRRRRSAACVSLDGTGCCRRNVARSTALASSCASKSRILGHRGERKPVVACMSQHTASKLQWPYAHPRRRMVSMKHIDSSGALQPPKRPWAFRPEFFSELQRKFPTGSMATPLLVPVLLGLLPSSQPSLSRRGAVLGAGAQLLAARRASAADDVASSVRSLRAGSLDATRDLAPGMRAPTSSIARASYGRESADVYYPEWALARWRVTSTLRNVVAPLGPELFSPGRNGTRSLETARVDVGKPLVYEVRWRRTADGRVVVDRPYNVGSITRASMGSKAVQGCEEDGPDHLTLYVSPSGAPGGAVFRADVRVVARHSDPQLSPSSFDCAETVRQTVVLAPGERSGPAPPPQVKEIETICTYDLQPGGEQMRGEQRTATFLAPDTVYTSASSLAEQQGIVLSRRSDGTMLAIDVRHYDLVYEKIV